MSYNLVAEKLPVSIAGCSNITNIPDDIVNVNNENIFPLFRISFHWINPIGFCSVIIVGSIVSYFTGARNLEEIDPELITPCLHR